MANPDHVAQLRKGVASWNAWREENHILRPDLLLAAARIRIKMAEDAGDLVNWLAAGMRGSFFVA